MNAAEVMTTSVITISPNASIQEVAQSLLANRISALPVVDDDGKLLGIVSEGDLLHRAEAGTEVRGSWWLHAFRSNESLATEFVKSNSRKVADVMTQNVITVEPETTLKDIASLLEKKHIKRVPVVSNGKVVGIVSRANLLQAVACGGGGEENEVDRRAENIGLRQKVLNELKDKPWTIAASINIIAHEGVVDLWGIVGTEKEKQAIRVAAENTSGVKEVNDHLAVLPLIYGGL